jgi:hypothetical protein
MQASPLLELVLWFEADAVSRHLRLGEWRRHRALSIVIYPPSLCIRKRVQQQLEVQALPALWLFANLHGIPTEFSCIVVRSRRTAQAMCLHTREQTLGLS